MEQKQTAKAPMSERVNEKMGMAKWLQELYYQNAFMFMSDSRYKSLPSYLQTSGVSSTFIALKASLDKIREDRDAKKDAEKLIEISKTEDQAKKA
mgnify:CR=1 FL=1